VLNLGAIGSSRISPTAHYTGHVWARHELGPRELSSFEGAAAYWSIQPVMTALGRAGRATLEDALLARHAAIDSLLRSLVHEHDVGQVVELAAGMSPRGLVLTEELGPYLRYIEADLPAMARLKRDRLARFGELRAGHDVADVDVLDPLGPASIRTIMDALDPQVTTAVVTEGLVPYLSRAQVLSLWGQIAEACGGFPVGFYLSDVYLAEDGTGWLEACSRRILGRFVGASVDRVFADAGEARAALHDSGFPRAEVLRSSQVPGAPQAASRPGGQAVRLLIASAGNDAPS